MKVRRPFVVALIMLVIIGGGGVLLLKRTRTTTEKASNERDLSMGPDVNVHLVAERQRWLQSEAWKQRQAGQHLAVLVPYRDRADDLAEFLPTISEHLERLGVSFDIYVVEQQAEFRFNRGALLNVGFIEATSRSGQGTPASYVALHDVDMVPAAVASQPHAVVDYGWVAGARSLATCVQQFGWRQPYPSYLGGVLLVNSDAYRQAGGMPTRYWGWGGEDDDFAVRLAAAGVSVSRSDPYCLDALRNTRGPHTERVKDPNRIGRLGASDRFASMDRLDATRYQILNVSHPLPNVHHLLVELEAAGWVRAAHQNHPHLVHSHRS